MVSLMSLWLPIVLSAVFVFVASSIIHMVLKYHNSDFSGFSNEDEVMEAMGKGSPKPGMYFLPYAGTTEAMQDKAYIEKRDKGPVAFITVSEPGDQGMGKTLFQWFLYCVFVSFFAAYIASRALGPEAYYLEVFRFVGAASFAGYAFALIPQSIWYKTPWKSTLKSIFDGLVYSLLTAGTFGWLWV